MRSLATQAPTREATTTPSRRRTPSIDCTGKRMPQKLWRRSRGRARRWTGECCTWGLSWCVPRISDVTVVDTLAEEHVVRCRRIGRAITRPRSTCTTSFLILLTRYVVSLIMLNGSCCEEGRDYLRDGSRLVSLHAVSYYLRDELCPDFFSPTFTVLCYSPYNKALTEVVRSGALGPLINVVHIEPVGW